MLELFKRWLRREPDPVPTEVNFDVAEGDAWAPVPVAAQAQNDNVMSWLQEPDPIPRPRRASPGPAPGAAPSRADEAATLQRMGEHFTEEELRVLREQLAFKG